jgi:hypothetical protein
MLSAERERERERGSYGARKEDILSCFGVYPNSGHCTPVTIKVDFQDNNGLYEGINTRINLGNTSFLSSTLLSISIKIRICRTAILGFLYGC